MQAYFGWAKPCSCLCSWYCFSRHLWFYDSGRLGRLEIVTLTVGARAKEGKRGGGGEKKIRVFSSLSPPPPRSLWLAPSPPLIGKFQHGAFASKLGAKRKHLHCRLSIWLSQLTGTCSKVTPNSFSFSFLPIISSGSGGVLVVLPRKSSSHIFVKLTFMQFSCQTIQ